jgi:Sigma-70 factor, region 1.1
LPGAERVEALKPVARQLLAEINPILEAEERRHAATRATLLDLSDASVQQLVSLGEKRGYVTLDELNEVLPTREVSADEIEVTMSMLSDMGIKVVEREKAVVRSSDATQKKRNKDDGEFRRTADGRIIITTPMMLGFLAGFLSALALLAQVWPPVPPRRGGGLMVVLAGFFCFGVGFVLACLAEGCGRSAACRPRRGRCGFWRGAKDGR